MCWWEKIWRPWKSWTCLITHNINAQRTFWRASNSIDGTHKTQLVVLIFIIVFEYRNAMSVHEIKAFLREAFVSNFQGENILHSIDWNMKWIRQQTKCMNKCVYVIFVVTFANQSAILQFLRMFFFTPFHTLWTWCKQEKTSSSSEVVKKKSIFCQSKEKQKLSLRSRRSLKLNNCSISVYFFTAHIHSQYETIQSFCSIQIDKSFKQSHYYCFDVFSQKEEKY